MGASSRPNGQPDANGTQPRQPIVSTTSRRPCGSSRRSSGAHRAAVLGRHRQLPGRHRRDEREGVDLPVRVVDRGAGVSAPILEQQHVRDRGPLEERRGALGPQVDDGADRVDPEGRQRRRMVGGVEDDLGGAPRRPPVDAAGRPAPSSGGPSTSTGQRFVNARTRYADGASNPPTQNGQSSSGRFGRSWRAAAIATHSPVSASKRSSGSAALIGTRGAPQRRSVPAIRCRTGPATRG